MSNSKNKLKISGVLFAIIIAGMIMMRLELSNILDGMKRKKWPAITGTIIHNEVIERRMYIPLVYYKYRVNDINYTDKSTMQVPGFGMKSSRKEVAYKTISDNQIGKSVVVYYNPENPQDSRLKPGPKWSEFNRFSLGIILIILGVSGICLLREPAKT